MRKMMIVIVASLTLLQGCARNYQPIVDSKGMTGAYSNSRASEITDDIKRCKDLGKENTSAVVENGKIIYNVWWRARCFQYIGNRKYRLYGVRFILKNEIEERA